MDCRVIYFHWKERQCSQRIRLFVIQNCTINSTKTVTKRNNGTLGSISHFIRMGLQKPTHLMTNLTGIPRHEEVVLKVTVIILTTHNNHAVN